MKPFFAFCCFLALCVSSFANDQGPVKYLGGTVSGLSAGGTGRLDTASDNSLTFEYSGKKLAIPYDAIQSFDHTEAAARHFGVLPAIMVGLLKTRQHRHYFRIVYRDPNQVPQVAMFLVPKQSVRVLQAVLQTRVNPACAPNSRPRQNHKKRLGFSDSEGSSPM